jgi:nitrogen fixation NifU-like protein
MATELVRGKTVEEAMKITNMAVAEALDGLPPAKMHCSNLAQEAIAAALEDYRRKSGLAPNESVDCTGCCNSCNHSHGREDDFED